MPKQTIEIFVNEGYEIADVMQTPIRDKIDITVYLAPKRWRAMPGECCWCIDSDGEVVKIPESGCLANDNHYSFGNYFKTEEEAQAMADKISALLKGDS